MHIVLEGPDNSGKTSLAKALQRLVPELSYFHPGGPPKTFQAEVDCISEQLTILKEPTPYIIDRITPISQTIYSPDPVMNRARLDALKNYVRRPDVLIIYCRPPTDRLLRVQDLTWAEHDTDEMKQKVIGGMHGFVKAYDMFMTYVPCLHFDFESENASKLTCDVALAICEDRNAKGRIQRMITEGGM